MNCGFTLYSMLYEIENLCLEQLINEVSNASQILDHTLYPHKAHNQICATSNDQSHPEANVTVNTSKISHSQSLIITLRSAPRL